jgi:hypothetical protein
LRLLDWRLQDRHLLGRDLSADLAQHLVLQWPRQARQLFADLAVFILRIAIQALHHALNHLTQQRRARLERCLTRRRRRGHRLPLNTYTAA